MYIYLIRGGGLIKIGQAADVVRRLNQIQAMSPVSLELICVIACGSGSALESRLHERFKKQRDHGEWFNLSDIDIEMIKNEHDLTPLSYVYDLSAAYNYDVSFESRRKAVEAGNRKRIEWSKHRRAPVRITP